MIKTETEYTAAKNFLDRDMSYYSYELSERMSSNEYNLYLQDAEFYLDILYEKLRTVEDMIDFLEDYSEQKINKVKGLIDSKELILEKMTDSFIAKESSPVNVSWDNNPFYRITDRDGEELQIAKKNNADKIVSAPASIKEISVKEIRLESDLVPDSNNIDTCIADNIYISGYNLDNPKTIKERLFINVANPAAINNIEFTALNCDIEVSKDVDSVILEITAGNCFKNNENMFLDSYIGSGLESNL